MASPLRWGILSAGKICHEFVSAIKELPKSDHILQGIACRKKEDAQKFSELHQFQTIHESYESLASDPNIDIVYIGSVNYCHYEQAKMCIHKGKHVLVEKPLCITGKEARDLVQLAREKKVFMMEGFWTRFFPAMRYAMKEMKDGKIGTVYQVILTVGNICSHLDRFRLRDLGGGSLMNHGVYGVAFATALFGKPDQVVATGHLSDQGVDLDTTCVMQYNQGYSAVTVCNSLVKMPGELFYIGTKGTLKIPWPYWCPTVVESSIDGKKEFPLPDDLKSTAHGLNTIGFVYEAEEVRRCIQQGLLECPEMPLDESVLIYEVCDELRAQLGVKFPQDEDK